VSSRQCVCIKIIADHKEEPRKEFPAGFFIGWRRWSEFLK